MVLLDEINIAVRLIGPGERIVSSQVIMALLGASTVQVGAIVYLVARHMLSDRRRQLGGR